MNAGESGEINIMEFYIKNMRITVEFLTGATLVPYISFL
jgi:hypothetical protein